MIDHLWKGLPNVPYWPKKFKEVLGKLNPLFEGNNAGDSKDLACYLIMQLHTELNNLDESLRNKDFKPNFNKDIIVNPYNSKEVFTYFANDFAINHNSVISKYFYGVNQGMFECQFCKLINMKNNINVPIIKYNYENFFFLEFPLDEVRKFICNNMNMNYQNIKEVNMDDCFNYNGKLNEMEGYCEKCGSDNAKILTKSQIYSGPNILMIIFNRGKGLEFDIKINFPFLLNLPQIFVNNNTFPTYELIGVIKHLGDSSASGHFIAYCKSQIPQYSNKWYCYNDKTVVEANDLKTIHNVGHTYILFYQIKNNK